jgi:uncharacterized protein
LTPVPYEGTVVPIMGTTPARSSMASALFGKTRLAVLSLLYGRPDRAFYVREVVRAAGSGQGAVQRELVQLAEAGLIERVDRDRQVYYQANRSNPIFEELRALVVKTAGLADVLREALSPMSARIDWAFIYGSQASGESTAASDIDLLVVGETDEIELLKAVSAAEARLEREVNYSLMSPDEFRRRAAEPGAFLQRVLTGPKIDVIGGETDVRGSA